MSDVPNGSSVHSESGSSIWIKPADPSTGTSEVFLNPAQEYNRDLSIVAIRVWSEIWAKEGAEKKAKARQRKAERPNKKRKIDEETVEETSLTDNVAETSKAGSLGTPPAIAVSAPSTTQPAGLNGSSTRSAQRTFTCFEGLAASGLRSIRYAKEIPLLRWVIANDLSASAVNGIHEHVKLNGLQPEEGQEGRVKPNQGDCTDMLYSHRSERKRFDVVDLDPYGSAAPFFDAAVQAVSDGGLLCVTCTDMAVLAGAQYPEKCFSNYGGVPIRGELTHEVALRLVLHGLSSCAVRYGRQIVPMLSLSIDFYVRLFVRVYISPSGAKKASADTGIAYSCHGCQAIHTQRMTRAIGDEPNVNYKTATGPPVGGRCEECGGSFALGGPLWLGPLHDRTFVAEMLQHVNGDAARYGTLARLRGMLAVAESELETPFYCTPSRIASHFQSTAPSLTSFASALLRAGYDISRSHAAPGSLKTTAPSSVQLDIMRAWIANHPVKMDNIKEGNPARALLAKASTLTDVSFALHPEYEGKMLSDVKIQRYQEQPAGYGPMALAKGGKGSKRRKA